MAVAVGGLMSGCTTGGTASDQALRIHLPKVVLNLDPQKMEDAYSMAIVSQIHRGLFRYDTTGEVLPDLAESWSESPDHRTYRIKLRSAKFSDGTPITAKDVQLTIARMFRVGASMAGDIDYIEGARQFQHTLALPDLGVRPVGPETVEFRLEKPTAIFLKQLAVVDCAILKLADFKDDPDLSKHGAFSGPYRISSDLKDGTLTISKWRTDALDSPRPPHQVTYFMTDENPVTLALSGKTDTLDHDRVESSDQQALAAHGWNPTPTELSGELFVVLNPETINDEVRRTMVASVDAENLITAVARPSYRPAFGLIPFGLRGELNHEEFRQIIPGRVPVLRKAVQIHLDYEGSSQLEERIVEYLTRTWAKVGILVQPHSLSKGEKLRKLFGKQSQAIIGRKAMDYPDGFSVLGYFKGSYPSNYFYVKDANIDRALAAVLQVRDPQARESEYREIQKQILKKWTLIPLLFGSEASGLWGPKIKSVPSHPLGYHMLPIETVEMRE